MLLMDVQYFAVANYFTCYPYSPKEVEIKSLISAGLLAV